MTLFHRLTEPVIDQQRTTSHWTASASPRVLRSLPISNVACGGQVAPLDLIQTGGLVWRDAGVFPVLHHPMRRVAPARYWYPKAASACLASCLASLLMPMRPWPAVRCLGKLMYEVFSHSLLPVSGALIYTVRSHYVGLAHVMSVALRYWTFTSGNRL